VEGVPGVSVCFPAYNEERTIERVLEDAHALLSVSAIDYEILVCDDASADRTRAIIDEFAARRPHVRVLRHATNKGIRETFEHLYREARKEFVFLNSADGQWDTAVLLELLPKTRDWDIIVAARRQKHYPAFRALISWAFNRVPGVLFGVRTHDAGAVKLVRREIIERFALVSRSPFSEAERIIRATRAGYRVTDQPTDTRPRTWGRAGGARARLVTQAVADVARVWWALKREARSLPDQKDRATESSHANQR